MSKFLIVAEVDKIQSFVFRSSRLREVVGASYLLEKFGEEIKADYVDRFGAKNILSSKGGSFRFIVDVNNQQEIDSIKQDLRQRFEKSVGGTITITSLPYTSDRTIIKEGNSALRRAKLEGGDPEPLWHSPYHAICASSGEELAVAHERPGGFIDKVQPRFPDERPRYMGKTTLKKSDEQAAINLLDAFITRMKAITRIEDITKLSNPTEADTYAQFDPRQYVAYLVSDGNGMGKIFNACLPTQLSELSGKIGEITSDALIHAAEGMCAETHRNGQMQFPILPLISGGDDLFVLMPAPWAVHVAMEFSRNYQDGMTSKLHDMGLLNEEKNATTGVAVVICKASYPYRTAYRYAHELLGKAKKRAKDINQSCLIVDFVVGSDTVAESHRVEPHPYTFSEAKYFTRRRCTLNNVPARIRHQVEDLFTSDNDSSAIAKQIDTIANRVNQLYPNHRYAGRLQRAFKRNPNCLRELLKLWDFCYDMGKTRDAYLTEER